MQETLNRNQNRPLMAWLITGTANSRRQSASSSSAAPTRTFCWIGSFRRFTSGNVSTPEPANSTTGKTILSGMSSQPTLGNGRSQPPQKSVTATDETTKMLAYSARK